MSTASIVVAGSWPLLSGALAGRPAGPVPDGSVATILAAGATVAAVVAWPAGRHRRPLRRLAALARVPEQVPRPVPGPGAVRRRRPGGRIPAAAGAGCAVALFAGLPWGAAAGLVAAVAVAVVLGRLEPGAVRERRDRAAADLPVAVDLLAACLRAGATPAAAAGAVATALGGPVAEALTRVAGLLRLGGDPARSWAVLEADPVLAPLGRAVVRATGSGAPLAGTLDRIGADARDARRAGAEERARRVGVLAAAPLGLCFLPAFVVLGVVPVVAGVAQDLRLW